MEKRIANWIVNVAEYSMIFPILGLLVWFVIFDLSALEQPIWQKTLGLFFAYLLSLGLVQFSLKQNVVIKLLLWISTLSFHLYLVWCVVYVFKESSAVIFVIPEILICSFSIYGIASILKSAMNAGSQSTQ